MNGGNVPLASLDAARDFAGLVNGRSRSVSPHERVRRSLHSP